MENDMKDILLDSLKHQRKETKFWKKFCVILICFIVFISCFYYAGFVWYESQFEYIDTTTGMSTSDVDISTEGENANAEYNDVDENQYNDNATHSQ